MVWFYLATPAGTTLGVTLELVFKRGIIARRAFAEGGALIANVQQLHIGDSLVLCWREDGQIQPLVACRVLAPKDPVRASDGTPLVIDRIPPAQVPELGQCGAEDAIEAIRVMPIFEPLSGEYLGQNALRQPGAADAGLVARIEALR